MNRDDILAMFDQAFGAGKYPRGPAIALGEELIGVGRREAGDALFRTGLVKMGFKGLFRTPGAPVYGTSVSEVAGRTMEREKEGWRALEIRNIKTGAALWRRDNDATALFELQLLAGVIPNADQS